MSIVTQILLHLGSIIAALKDSEKAIQDAVSGKANVADFQKVLQDLADLLSSGIVSIPGISSAQIAQALVDIEKAL